jgi:hypothetical protein
MTDNAKSSLGGKLMVLGFLFLIVLYFAPAVAIGLLATLGLAVRTLLKVFLGAA